MRTLLDRFLGRPVSRDPAAPRAPSAAAVTARPVASDTPHHVHAPGRPAYRDRIVPGYYDAGLAIEALPVDALLAGYEEFIGRIRMQAWFSQEFDALLLPLIRRYAEFVHLLPASESHHHCSPGGLLRHGLEVMWFAAQRLSTKTFDVDATPSVRRRREPQWRFATLLAALLHDVGKVVTDVVVTDDRDREWNPEGESLASWLGRLSIPCYRYRFRGKRGVQHQAASGYIAKELAGTALMQFVGDDAASVRAALRTYFLGVPDAANEILAIVRAADRSSVEQDIAAQRHRLGQPPKSPARAVYDEMRRLVADGHWKPNEVGQPIWITNLGAFASHPDGILQALQQLALKGIEIESDPEAVALAMLNEELILPPKHQRVAQLIECWPTTKSGAARLELPMLQFADASAFTGECSVEPIRAARVHGGRDDAAPPVPPTPARAADQPFVPPPTPVAPAVAPLPTQPPLFAEPPTGAATPATPDLQPPPDAPPPTETVPLIRDRRDEIDPALAASFQRERDRIDPPAATFDELLTRIEARGIEWRYAAKVLRNADKGIGIRWHQHVRDIEGRLHVLCPGGINGCGVEPPKLESLWLASGICEPAATGTGRHELRIDGRPTEWFRLCARLSEEVIPFMPPRQGTAGRSAPLTKPFTRSSEREIKAAFVRFLSYECPGQKPPAGRALYDIVAAFAQQCGTTPPVLTKTLSEGRVRALGAGCRVDEPDSFCVHKSYMSCNE